MAKSTALVPFSAQTLKSQASQLSVVLDIDVPALQMEVEAHTQGLVTMQVQANALNIADEVSYADAMALMKDAQERESGLTKIWKRFKDVLNPARNTVLEMEHATVDPFTAIKQTLQRKGEKYLNDMRRAKAEAEAALARAADEQRQRLQREADALMAKGRVAQATAKIQEASITMTPTLADAMPVAADARVGTKFTGSCTDIIAFARAIVEGKVNLMQEVKPGDARPVLIIDQVVLNAVVSRQQDSLNWPGITVTSGAKISTR
jgi:hypothetical protein